MSVFGRVAVVCDRGIDLIDLREHWPGLSQLYNQIWIYALIIELKNLEINNLHNLELKKY